MTLLKIKPGAQPSDKLEMRKPREVAAKVFARHGMTVWLTSGMEGKTEHGVGTWHYAGYAEDYDGTRHVSPEEWQEIEDECRDEVGCPYQWVAHKGHIHSELDLPEFAKYKL